MLVLELFTSRTERMHKSKAERSEMNVSAQQSLARMNEMHLIIHGEMFYCARAFHQSEHYVNFTKAGQEQRLGGRDIEQRK